MALPALMLTELEERLAGPQGAAVRERLLADLAALELRLQQRLRQLQRRKDFEDTQAALAAVRAARAVVQDWCVGGSRAPSEAQRGCTPRPRLS